MRKYTLYAIGEIALVVIGILLALQINNWNEDRKGKLEVKSSCEGIILDLLSDLETLNGRSEFNETVDGAGKRIWKILNDEIVENDSNELKSSFLFAGAIREFSPRRNAFDGFMDKGTVHFLNNQELIEILVDYYKHDEYNEINLAQRRRYIDEYNDLRFKFIDPMMLRVAVGNIRNSNDSDAKSLEHYTIDWPKLKTDNEYKMALGKLLSQRTWLRDLEADIKEQINILLEMLNEEIAE